jgi:hypothetical protein
MRLTREFIEHLSARLIDHLTGRESIRTTVSPEHLSARIARVITEDLMIEDRLNEEVKEILKAYESEIEKGRLDYRKMFHLTKQKLARERNLIL